MVTLMDDMKTIQKKCKEIISNPEVIDTLLSEHADLQNLYSMTSDLEIIITPKDVIEMLRKWQQNLFTTQDLVKWASFIVISGAYTTEEINDDFLHFTPLWGIVGEISTPEIDGSLTLERSNEYIKELSKL